MAPINLPAPLSQSTITQTQTQIANMQRAELTLWIERLRHIRQAILNGTDPLMAVQVALDAAVSERSRLTQ